MAGHVITNCDLQVIQNWGATKKARQEILSGKLFDL